MVDRNLLYDFGDEGEGEAPTFNERWGSLPVEAPRFNLTPNVALVESTPKPLKQGTDPVTGRPDLKFVPVDDPWANTPKPIKRLLGVGGEERFQWFPERILRSGLSAPLDALTGKMQVNDPETGMPTDEAIRRSQDVASVGGPGGMMNLREEGVLGSHGGNLTQPTPKVAAPFYSAVEHAVSNGPEKALPSEWLGPRTERNYINKDKTTGKETSVKEVKYGGLIGNMKGVKPEELEWMGLPEWLQEKANRPGANRVEPVTKQEVQDYVNANKVELKEVNKTENPPSSDIPLKAIKTNGYWEIRGPNDEFVTNVTEPMSEQAAISEARNRLDRNNPSEIRNGTAKYGPKGQNKVLPGGENYKEMLMTLPRKDLGMQGFGPEKQAEWQQLGQMGSRNRTEAQNQRWMQLDDELNNIRQSKGNAIEYKSSHWDEPNPIAHVRTNDRNITAPGETTPKKSLHIEEIQSDWHQAGRDKGYASDADKSRFDKIYHEELPKARENLSNVIKDIDKENGFLSTRERLDRRLPRDENRTNVHNNDPRYQAAQNKINELESEMHKANPASTVPDAPFKKTWHELALKRMIREAAEKGYDRLSWTPGEAQAARYDLSKQVDKIIYNPKSGSLVAEKNGSPIIQKNTELKDLASEIGKEAADKIVNNPTRKVGPNQEFHYLEGEGLKVGGEGMKGFYDKMIPNAIEKIGKEHGVKVKQADIGAGENAWRASRYMNGLGRDQEIAAAKSKEELMNILKQQKQLESNGEFTGTIKQNTQSVHYIDIPESLKNQALGKGFPLFSSGGHFLNPIPGNPHEQVDNSHHVPYGAGASNTPTGFPVNIDKRIPKYDDKLKLPNGQPADLHKYLTIHEIEEYKAMKAGIPYHKAHHDIATPMEKKAVESDGVSWKEYEEILNGYLKKTEDEGYKNLPPALYLKPYRHSRSLSMKENENDK